MAIELPGVLPSVEFNQELVKVVRESQRRNRAPQSSESSPRNGFGQPTMYVTHAELSDVTTPVKASRMLRSVYTAAQIVLEDDSDFTVTIQGIESGTMRANMTATEIRAVMQQLLPNLEFSVYKYTGRVLIVCTDEDSADLATIDLESGNGYAQEFHSTKGSERDVFAMSAHAGAPIPPGTLCFGIRLSGVGIRVIPECRTYSGDTETVTEYLPPSETVGEWNEFTGASLCTPVLPLNSTWSRETAVEPSSGSAIQFEFTGGVLEIPSSNWTKTAAGANWDIDVTLSGIACDFHSSGFTIISGAPVGVPTRWRQ